METITKARRLFNKDRLSQREIAKKLQLDRRTIRKYLNSTKIPRYQRKNYLSPKLGPSKLTSLTVNRGGLQVLFAEGIIEHNKDIMD